MATPTPVVLIPALLCDEALYADVIARLGDAIEPHVMMSPLPDLHASAADILARAPARFALVGTSYGGNLALTVALAAPERVSALWIMGANPPAAGPDDPDLAGALAAMPEAVIEQLASLVVAPDATAARATFRAMATRVGGQVGAAQAAAMRDREDLMARVGGLHVPTLAFWGGEDAITPPAIGRALADEMPHAHFFALPGCGHLPTLERPAESAAAFAAFLEDEHGHGH